MEADGQKGKEKVVTDLMHPFYDAGSFLYIMCACRLPFFGEEISKHTRQMRVSLDNRHVV